MSQWFYVSLQFSAIQKTICRVDRLWSMAGISKKIAMLNEVDLPRLSSEFGGETLVAGGGKFTARFATFEQAKSARETFKKYISTSFPMLEYQLCTNPLQGTNLNSLVDRTSGEMFADLFKQKDFRGYSICYPPHIMLCGECGELPAVKYAKNSDEKSLCSLCAELKSKNYVSLNEVVRGNVDNLPTAEKNYARYSELLSEDFPDGLDCINIPLDFNDMVTNQSSDEEVAQKMAIWFADVNNLGKKVTVWLSTDESELRNLFQKVKDVFIEICSQALAETFKYSSIQNGYLPFRIIIAGGDDLCIAMQEKFALSFTQNIANAVESEMTKINNDRIHPLSDDYLLKNAVVDHEMIGPYCLGASFVISSVHIPFRRLYELGEELMRTTKIATERKANGINWRVLCGDTFVDDGITYDKPLYVTNKDVEQAGKIGLEVSLQEYRSVAKSLLDKKFSNSQLYSIGQQLAQNPDGLQRWLTLRTSVEVQRASNMLLDDREVRGNPI